MNFTSRSTHLTRRFLMSKQPLRLNPLPSLGQRTLPSLRPIRSPRGPVRQFATSKDPEDLYMKNNLEQNVSVKDKIVDLGKFIDRVELCMVTTAKGDPPSLVSRCMGVAGKVCIFIPSLRWK